MSATGCMDWRTPEQILADNLKYHQELKDLKKELQAKSDRVLINMLDGEIDFSYREAELLKKEIKKRLLAKKELS